MQPAQPRPGGAFASGGARPRSVGKRRCSRWAVVAIRVKLGANLYGGPVNFVAARDSLHGLAFVCARVTPSRRKKLIMAEHQRCGRCIAGDHDHCIVVLKMGTSREVGHRKASTSYLWRCGCWCRSTAPS